MSTFDRAAFTCISPRVTRAEWCSFPSAWRSPLSDNSSWPRPWQRTTKGIPVALPGLLAKKYPYAAHSERWAWFFPSRTTCRDPRGTTQVRWRCHESNVQRAVKEAASRCHLEGLTPHCLRHAYATHALHGGAFVRDLQVVLGHRHLDTTMLYLHTEAGRVTSPLQNYVSIPNQGNAIGHQ